MINGVDLTSDLQAWCRRARLDMVQGSQTKDGRTVIWGNAGEVRYYIYNIEGWYVITCSDRMGPEAYDFAATSMHVIERYLYGVFGGSVRNSAGLPYIRAPFSRKELRPGYSIGKTEFFWT
ncbi:Imm61 family immunity protein [Mycobacterium pseudokansasii]|uniref:Imm61 family immunity protein n=1 Tax=Mycobacterium pseudokansasii TaxID=2341080 RepID=UPI000A745D23|nr:Immunity factor for TNT [Mycobacterium pseudokansasii]VAZ97713.1 Immunity factor for TNT [Mycobacterium pseudokansasii]